MGVLGLVASAVPALLLCGGRERHGTPRGMTHHVAVLHVPQRLALSRYARELGHFTSEILQFSIVSKVDYNSKYNQEAARQLWLLLKDKHQEPLPIPSCCKTLSEDRSPPLLVAVRNARPGHIWYRYSVARLVLSMMFRISASVHSKNEAARLKS